MQDKKGLQDIIDKSIQDEGFFRGYVVSELEGLKKSVIQHSCKISIIEKFVYTGIGGIACINLFIIIFTFLKNSL